MAHRELKDRLYREFARVGQALSNPIRLELLDLLAQGPRHVDALSAELDTPMASVSQHLQVLRRASLVESQRVGTRAVYQLADASVLHLWLALRAVAETRLADVERLVRESDVLRFDGEFVTREEVDHRLAAGDLVVVDVRPELEFRAGHLAGARSLPIDELSARVDELPMDRDVVVYCRGTYCAFADEAIDILRERGIRAHRLEGGWVEWVAERRPVDAGSDSGSESA